LETEFIPDVYDKSMRSTFGDQYYDKVNADDLLEEAEHVED
jgi:hypothetical protein